MMDMPQIGVFHRLMQTLASDDSRDGIEHGNSRDNERHQHDHKALRPNDAHHRHDADDQPEQQRSGIAHEHRGGKEIVAQKRKADGNKRKADEHEGEASPHQNKVQQSAGDYGHQTRSEPVQPIDQVGDVHEHHEVQHGQRIVAHDQRAHRADGDARKRDDRRGHNLPRQLHAGRQLRDVVHQTHGEHCRHADEQYDVVHVAQNIQIMQIPIEEPHSEEHRETCRDQPNIQRDASATRDRLAIHTTIPRVVDSTDPKCDLLGNGYHAVRDRKGHGKHDYRLIPFHDCPCRISRKCARSTPLL